jgi:DNA-binding transcriptional LysR family regulator
LAIKLRTSEQETTTGEIGINGQFALQQFRAAHVCCGFGSCANAARARSISLASRESIALARRKLKRRVALRAPFLSAGQVLIGSDMVGVVPRRIADELVRYRPLAIRPLALVSPVIDIAMIWPRRLDSQPAHQWLRNNVLKVADRLGAE